MKKIVLLFITMLAAYGMNAQYCTTSIPFSTADEEIFNVSFSTINNTTNCAAALNGTQGTALPGSIATRYANFTGIAPAPVFGGSTYPFSVTINTCGSFNYNSGMKIYIDYNHDNDFIDPGEEVYFTGTGNNITCIPQTIVTGNITIPLTALPGITRMRIIDWEGGQFSATTITPCGSYGYGETEDYLINVIPPVPCSGQVNAGTINKPDTVNICPSASVTMCSLGGSAMSNIYYQWFKSTNGGATWTTNPGDTFICYTVPPYAPSALYMMTAMCLNNFSMDTSQKVYVNVKNPTYAAIPYTQGFESWMDYCSTKDVPDDGHWASSPNLGDNAWRRFDEGSTAGWSLLASGAYLPPSSQGSYSARFHSYYASSPGNLDLYLDLSSSIGPKDLLFDLKLPDPNLTMGVSFSTNGGSTFTTIGTYTTPSNWGTQLLTLTSNSNTCVVRFTGFTNTFYSDMGIDNIKVVPPCTGTPQAGIIPDTTACPNDSFSLTTVGTSLAAGLSYTWQSSSSATGPWTTIGTTAINTIKTVISAPTYFQCIVTCVASGQSSTTPVQYTGINSFYYCYCHNGATSSFDAFDVGNTQLLKPKGGGLYDTLIDIFPIAPTDTFNNANAYNTYTNYQFGFPISKIYKDSMYEGRITDITQYSWTPYGSTTMFIDFDRDGIFQAYEQVGGNSIGSNNGVSFQFLVPTNAATGITGLRVITSDVGNPTGISACGAVNSGEVEDYLVEIVLPDCKAPTDPGIAYITDSLMCPGYTTIVYDTNHTLISAYNGLTLQWQSSPNSSSWTDIAGANQDTLFTIVNAQTYYRLKIICSGNDTVYSNTKVVNMIPSYACYPASASFGGNTDTADNGYFTIGNYSFSSAGATGPHVGNPSATRARTDFTGLGASLLYADSTYPISFYNILRPYNHADAKITMFVDYNNNGVYDIPNERIFTGISGPTSFYLPSSFHTPINPVLGVATGMRVVLNNNTLANNASDLGVGLYTSGETEDFLVKFEKKPVVPESLHSNSLLQNVAVYPNPSNGIVFVDLEAYELQNLKITITTIAGAEVLTQSHKNINGKFGTSINLSSLAKGTYMVKLQSERGSVVQKITLE